MTQKNDLGRDPIGKLLMRLAIPAVTAQLINALYNIVDRMYIGHIPEVGDLALTGLGLCFPIIIFISALSSFAGMGGSARASIAMGEGDMDAANGILGNCFTLLTVLALAATGLFMAFCEPLLVMFGASANTLPYASSYLSIYLIGTISVQYALGLNFFISAQGFSKISMSTVLIGAITNIVLDPIFIFGFDMGVEGAALATILAQTISALWVLRFLTSQKSRLRIQRQHLGLNPKILLPVMAIGVSPFIMQATESLVNISLNSSLSRYGNDTYVGAMTICTSVIQVLQMPMTGLSQAAQPIIGYNYGANQLDRVRQTYSIMLKVALAISCTGFLLVQLFPTTFIMIFNNKPELVAATKWAIRIYFGGFFMLGLQFACQHTFVALGQAKISLVLALLRKVILLIPLVFILPLFLENQVFAIYVAAPIADILAASTTGLVFLWQFPKILKKRAAQVDDTSS